MSIAPLLSKSCCLSQDGISWHIYTLCKERLLLGTQKSTYAWSQELRITASYSSHWLTYLLSLSRSSSPNAPVSCCGPRTSIENDRRLRIRKQVLLMGVQSHVRRKDAAAANSPLKSQRTPTSRTRMAPFLPIWWHELQDLLSLGVPWKAQNGPSDIWQDLLRCLGIYRTGGTPTLRVRVSFVLLRWWVKAQGMVQDQPFLLDSQSRPSTATSKEGRKQGRCTEQLQTP